jgi:hypothetical protein
MSRWLFPPFGAYPRLQLFLFFPSDPESYSYAFVPIVPSTLPLSIPPLPSLLYRLFRASILIYADLVVIRSREVYALRGG